MSDQIYPSAKTLFLTGSFDWLTDPIAAVLVNTTFYTYSPAHQTLLDVPVQARVAASGTLTGLSVLGGVVDADDTTFGSVTGNLASAVILTVDTGTDATSNLICYLDSGTGFPVNPDGGVIQLVWSNNQSKIFSL